MLPDAAADDWFAVTEEFAVGAIFVSVDPVLVVAVEFDMFFYQTFRNGTAITTLMTRGPLGRSRAAAVARSALAEANFSSKPHILHTK